MIRAMVIMISVLGSFAMSGCGKPGEARLSVDKGFINLDYNFDYVDNNLLGSRMRTVLINADGNGLVLSNGSVYGYVTPERIRNHPNGSLIGWVFINVQANGTGYITSTLIEMGPMYTGYKLYRRDGDQIPTSVYHNDTNVAQQVDSAEPSTVAVPPSMPSGSAR